MFGCLFQWIEKLNQAPKTVLNHFSNHLKVCQKKLRYPLFFYLCGQTWSLVIDEHRFVITREYFISQTNVFHESVAVMN